VDKRGYCPSIRLYWILSVEYNGIRVWDGVFLDQFGKKISDRGRRFGYKFDLDLDGIPEDSATADSLWREGIKYIIQEIRNSFPNCFILTEHPTDFFNIQNGKGFLGFPWNTTTGGVIEPPGTWLANMKIYKKWEDTSRSCVPLNAFFPGVNVKDSINYRFMRFGLASTLMLNGFFGHFRPNVHVQLHRIVMKWFDEYSVDNLGVADTTGAFTGWLGMPLDTAYQLDTLVWRRDFEYGTAIVSNLPNNESLWVDLEDTTYAFIKGIIDPVHNTGDTIWDGIWMKGRDTSGIGHGVVLVNIRTIGVSEEREVNEQKITFSLIGPNPFYSISKIKYFIPKSSHIELKIYNLTGQLVKTLVDKEQREGIYIVEWDGKDRNKKFVPSGIYFIKLSGDEFSEIKKLVLLR